MFKSDQTKKLFIILGSVLIVGIVIFVVYSIMSGGNVKLTYKEMEAKIKEVGQKYYDENKALLPKNDGESKEVSVDDLVKLEMMKPLDEISKEDGVCTGKAIVKNVNGKYSYIGYLDCGKDYVTSELSKKIINDNPVTSKGSGLYLQNEEYVFRGESLKNYVKFANTEWRILKIDKSGDIKLIQVDKESESVPYDDRYNNEKEYTAGKNDYSISRIKDTLNKIYESKRFTNEERSLIVPKNLCVGSRSENDIINDGSIECSNTIENQYIGLLQTNEFINASIDSSCSRISDSQCQNYNYLAGNSDYEYWTLTPVKGNTYQVYNISSYSTIGIKTCSSYSSVKPVIYVSKDVMFDSGDGSKDKPYVIK